MIFEFYWSWYEDYCPILLEGPDKTPTEFKADCKKAMAESFDEYMKQVKKDSWASLPDWIKIAAVKLEDYGYKIFKPIEFGYFGLYLPKDNEFDKEYHDEDEDQLPEFTEQIATIKKHNTKLDKEMHKDLYDKIDEEENEER